MQYTDTFQNYLERRGKKGEQALKALAEVGVSLKALLDSPMGKIILDEDIKRYEDLLMRLASGEDNQEYKAELKYLHKRLEYIVSLMQAQKTLLEEIKGE